MMKTTNKYLTVKGLLIILFSTLIFVSIHYQADGQEKPPKPIQVYVSPTQGLLFGTFYHGSIGGTLTVSHDGIRSATGSVIPLSLVSLFSPAIFQVEGIKGTVISITDNSSTAFHLTGSNGGSLTLHLGDPQTNTDCGTPFILNKESPDRMEIRIGGTLYIGNSTANPPGNYSGTFTVTFNQE